MSKAQFTKTSNFGQDWREVSFGLYENGETLKFRGASVNAGRSWERPWSKMLRSPSQNAHLLWSAVCDHCWSPVHRYIPSEGFSRWPSTRSKGYLHLSLYMDYICSHIASHPALLTTFSPTMEEFQESCWHNISYSGKSFSLCAFL